MLPWVVRGRSLAGDIAGASAWTAGLAAATSEVARRLGTSEPRGLVLGTVAAGVLAAALAATPARNTVGHHG